MFHIESLKSRIDPQFSYSFIVTVSDGIIPPTYVENITFSYPDIGVEVLSIQNVYLKYAGRKTQPGVTVDFYEDHDNNIQKLLESWRSLIINSDGTYSYPSSYKKELSIWMLRNNNEDDVSTKIICSGVFPSNSNPIRLSYSESGRIIVSQLFEVDDLKIFRPELFTSIKPVQ